MKSKFTEAFDSLESDEKIRSERANRVLSKYDDGQAAESIPQKSECIAKPRFFASNAYNCRRRFCSCRRDCRSRRNAFIKRSQYA